MIPIMARSWRCSWEYPFWSSTVKTPSGHAPEIFFGSFPGRIASWPRACMGSRMTQMTCSWATRLSNAGAAPYNVFARARSGAQRTSVRFDRSLTLILIVSRTASARPALGLPPPGACWHKGGLMCAAPRPVGFQLLRREWLCALRVLMGPSVEASEHAEFRVPENHDHRQPERHGWPWLRHLK